MHLFERTDIRLSINVFTKERIKGRKKKNKLEKSQASVGNQTHDLTNFCSQCMGFTTVLQPLSLVPLAVKLRPMH